MAQYDRCIVAASPEITLPTLSSMTTSYPIPLSPSWKVPQFAEKSVERFQRLTASVFQLPTRQGVLVPQILDRGDQARFSAFR